jgi:hypothetical protein
MLLSTCVVEMGTLEVPYLVHGFSHDLLSYLLVLSISHIEGTNLVEYDHAPSECAFSTQRGILLLKTRIVYTEVHLFVYELLSHVLPSLS